MLSGDPCNGLSGSTSALRCSYEVSYNNQCGSSKSITVTVTGRNDHGQTVTAGSTTVSIPTGSGKKKRCHRFWFRSTMWIHKCFWGRIWELLRF